MLSEITLITDDGVWLVSFCFNSRWITLTEEFDDPQQALDAVHAHYFALAEAALNPFFHAETMGNG